MELLSHVQTKFVARLGFCLSKRGYLDWDLHGEWKDGAYIFHISNGEQSSQHYTVSHEFVMLDDYDLVEEIAAQVAHDLRHAPARPAPEDAE